MYTITKTINGNMRPLHKGINSLETAKEMLVQIGNSYYKRRVNRGSWMISIDFGQIVYQVKENR